jgi:hypothetical protein
MRVPVSIFIIISLITTGCKISQDNFPDGSTSIEFRPLGILGYGADLFSCEKDCYTKLISKKDTTYFINSTEDYSKLILKASCLDVLEWPSVDFSKNSLLAGVIISPTSCARIVKEDLILNPFDMKYSMIVTLQQGASPVYSAIFFWVLTDKIPTDANISFEVRYNSIQ